MAIVIRTLIMLLGGVGLGEVLDKFFRDKIPFGTKVISDKEGFPKNLAIFAALSLVATFIIRFIVQKLKLTRTIKL